MTRFIAALALASGVAIAANAQDTTTKTTVKTDGDVKAITYTGCVQTGTETRSYVLNKVVPVSTTTTRTDAVGTTGTTTTTSYILVPGDKIELQTHVGKKVEVKGMMVEGDSKTTTTTKVDRDDAPDSKIQTTVKTDNATPQFRVTSIRDLGESCQS